jgi:hypothetical protein
MIPLPVLIWFIAFFGFDVFVFLNIIIWVPITNSIAWVLVNYLGLVLSAFTFVHAIRQYVGRAYDAPI